jgi:hypothetical protein
MGKCTLRLHAATYGREAISTLPLEGVDAVFATARTDFGGYSHAYSSFILEHLGLEQSPRTLTELDLQEDQCKRSTPYFIATPVVPNDAAAAKALTVELLKLCEKRGFQKVLLTQFIELKSKKDWAKHQNYLGILDALRASTPSKHLELIFCIDRRYQSFYEEAL